VTAVYLAFSFSALAASLAASSALSAALSALSSALSAASPAFSAACSLSSALFAGSLLPPQAVRARQAIADVRSRGFRMVSAISSWRAKRGVCLGSGFFTPAAPPVDKRLAVLGRSKLPRRDQSAIVPEGGQ